MLDYPFLVLSLLLLAPGALIAALRPDLRVVMWRMALASLPFALTESLFYPDYWSPRFLFDLVDHLGFGLEDLLFVAGLAAFTSTAWAFVARRRLVGSAPGAPRRALWLLALTFALVGLAAGLQIPMIYGACAIMALVSVAMIASRPALLGPALGGAAICALTYTGLCWLLGALIPNVFLLSWNTSKFLNIFVFGVPLEEILYAAAAGLAATAFYPWAVGARLEEAAKGE
jgi:hypothetical protein